MVRISISTAILGLSACATVFGTMVKRDPIVVLEDFKTLTPLVNGLINATNAFPAEGGTLVGFSYVHQNVTAVTGQINQTTTDIKAITKPVNDDCAAVNATYVVIQPFISKALSSYIAKKPAFLSIPEGIAIEAIIDGDVSSLNSSSIALQEAVTALCIIV